MDFKVELNKIGIDRVVKLKDSIKNTRKVYEYQEELFNNSENVETVAQDISAQNKNINVIIKFLSKILDLSPKEKEKLEDQSYFEVASFAGSIVDTILRTDEIVDDEEDDGEPEKK